MTPPPVTVLLPAYNASQFLAEAIASVRAQSFKAWRMLIVDDGSEDDTLTIAKDSSDADNRISVLAIQHIGMSAALNIGVGMIKTPWIARLDADDRMEPDRLLKQLTVAVVGKYAVLGTATREVIYSTGSSRVVLYPETDKECSASLSGIRARSPFAHSSVLMAREAVLSVGNYDMRWDLCQDLALFMRIAKATIWKMGNLTAPLTTRFIHPGQRSARTWQRRWDTWNIILREGLWRG